MRYAVLLCLLIAAPVSAAVYRCKTANGEVRFSDAPCAASEDEKVIQKPPAQASRTASVPKTSSGYLRTKLPQEPTKDLVDACLNVFRPQLRDPRGAYADGGELQNVALPEKPGLAPWREVVVYGRATNGFGGYIGKRFHCMLGDDLTIDYKRTEMYQSLFTLGVDP